MNTFAVISSSRNHSYDAFLPMTALMWRRVVGFEPLVLLTDTAAEWGGTKVGTVVLSTLLDLKVNVHFIGHIEGYLEAQASQSSRQHAAALIMNEDDVLITADQDMWPLNHDWFRRHDPAKYAVTLWYANAYGPVVHPSSPPYHCTPYVGATAKVWREVMGLRQTGEIASQLQDNFDRTLGRSHDSWMAWWHDELFFGSRLKAWHGYPSQCQFIEREGQPPRDRIDRSGWPNSYSKEFLAGIVDAHCIRPPLVAPNWQPLRDLLMHYLPEEDMKFIAEFVKAYRKARYE